LQAIVCQQVGDGPLGQTCVLVPPAEAFFQDSTGNPTVDDQRGRRFFVASIDA
jgi:hypothetical protein